MYSNVIQIGYEYKYSGTYQFVTTHEPDVNYRLYLARRMGEAMPFSPEAHSPDAFPVDISLDDVEGDVVAGLSAVIHQDVLIVDMIWVSDELQGQGIGKRLIQMAEELAEQRGCYRSRVRASSNLAFFVNLDYAITGTVQLVPKNGTKQPNPCVCWMKKELTPQLASFMPQGLV